MEDGERAPDIFDYCKRNLKPGGGSRGLLARRVSSLVDIDDVLKITNIKIEQPCRCPMQRGLRSVSLPEQ
ncbi:hypothetical protein GGR91_000953 [Sphingorhabdus rigui]|uniref:Uncharacterized protein n=1 Tax=Sphingorhabdus rigui TaxID=1282858 RepID=A0A840AYL7_9SPHN|nr:hypothetical protein [Sphingorhabdus rigui]